MSPKKRRKENQGLPKRWRVRSGAYYYRPSEDQRHLWDGKAEYFLGRTYSEALQAFALKVDYSGTVRSMDDLIKRYEVEVLPSKKPATQRSNRISINRIRLAFSGNDAAVVSTVDCYAYTDHITRNHGPTAANRDVEVLSHMFSMAIRWGVIEKHKHPIRGERMKNPAPVRRRYVEDWELAEFERVCGPFLSAYIALKGLTGYRKGDMLDIRHSQITSAGITRNDRKTGKLKTIEMTPELAERIDAIKSLYRGKIGSLYLFQTSSGRPYIKEDGSTSGFDSIWQRRMKKALAETDLAERFTEHDLRRKVGSDMPTTGAAQDLLDHSTPAQTDRAYRAKARVVAPAKGFKK